MYSPRCPQDELCVRTVREKAGRRPCEKTTPGVQWGWSELADAEKGRVPRDIPGGDMPSADRGVPQQDSVTDRDFM